MGAEARARYNSAKQHNGAIAARQKRRKKESAKKTAMIDQKRARCTRPVVTLFFLSGMIR
jgi:hypothetical protein